MNLVCPRCGRVRGQATPDRDGRFTCPIGHSFDPRASPNVQAEGSTSVSAQ